MKIVLLFAQIKLKTLNGYLRYKFIEKYTWTQRMRNVKTRIAYVIIKRISTAVCKKKGKCGYKDQLLVSKIYLPFPTPVLKTSRQT